MGNSTLADKSLAQPRVRTTADQRTPPGAPTPISAEGDTQTGLSPLRGSKSGCSAQAPPLRYRQQTEFAAPVGSTSQGMGPVTDAVYARVRGWLDALVRSLDPQTLGSLLAAGSLPRLQELDLSFSALGDAGVRLLLDAGAVVDQKNNDGATALRRALDMRPRERLARLAKDARFLGRATTGKWAYRVLADLKTVPRDRNPLRATHAGLGLGFRILGMKSGFDALQVDRVARAYRQAGQDAPSAAPTENFLFTVPVTG